MNFTLLLHAGRETTYALSLFASVDHFLPFSLMLPKKPSTSSQGHWFVVLVSLTSLNVIYYALARRSTRRSAWQLMKP